MEEKVSHKLQQNSIRSPNNTQTQSENHQFKEAYVVT